MNFLEKIIEIKKGEVKRLKKNFRVPVYDEAWKGSREARSLAGSLKRHVPAIIAEFKRKSPSKGLLNGTADITEVVEGYRKAGAAGISILTENIYFGGSIDDIVVARVFTDLPLLRKDFIIDDVQIFEAKQAGADAVLIIAAFLGRKQIRGLSQTARTAGLEVLLEIHSEEELDKINEYVNIIGVNNRNLKTLEVDTGTSFRLAEKIPQGFLKISESGISSPSTIKELISAGYDGFLIGERFMSHSDPARALEEFMNELKED